MHCQRSKSALHIASMILFLILAVSCSPTESNLTDPGITRDRGSANAHSLQGLYRVRINLGSGNTEVMPMRSSDSHFDVTKYLFPPFCADCFKINVVEIDMVDLELTADVTLKNFTKKLTGYDVRGIVYPLGDFVLKNPSAYTFLYAPPDVLDPSGFRAYKTDDPDRAMAPGESSTETYVIGFPSGAKFVDLEYAVDASAPDHCPEAYDIYGFEQTFLGSIPGSQALVSVYVADWQDNTSIVTVELDSLGGDEVTLSHISDELWSGIITNEFGAPIGDYPSMITAADTGTAFQLYQKVMLHVTNPADTEPPTWISDIGITEVQPGLTGVLVKFRLADDPSLPVTYNLYWDTHAPLNFDTADKQGGITESPYLLTGPDPGTYFFVIRAQDAFENETNNINFLSAEVGVHPNVYWTSGPPMQTPRAFSGGFFENGHFWVLGGYAFANFYDLVERYNTLTEDWDSPWSLPEGRDSFGCGTLNGKAYIFGGRLAETIVTDSCRIIDLATGDVDPTPPTLPASRAGVGCALLVDKFVITGGKDYVGPDWVRHRETWLLTPPGPDFEGETDLEFDTAGMGFAAGDDYVMTCGGEPQRTEVMYHELGQKSWQFRAPLPSGRESNCAVWVNGWLYSIGGMMIDHATADVQALDVAGDTWYAVNPLLDARFGGVAATDGSYIYVTGGIKAVGPAWIPLASLEIGQIF